MTTLEETHSRDAVVTLTFELSDSSLPVLASAEMDGCRFTLVEIVPGADGRHTAYYRVEGCDSNRVVDLTTEHDDCNAHVFDFGDSIALLKLTLTDDHPLVVLTAQGALPRRVVIADGETTLTVEVPPGFDVTDLISRFNAAFPDANLAARRQDASVTPLFSELAVERVLATRLTDRQRDVIQAAHDEGFYQWPREISGTN